MGRYFDRQGNEMTLMEYAKRERDDFRVAETTLPSGLWVSTVHLGLNHNWGDGPPLIFETMVFPTTGDRDELDCDRYATEAEALAGHEAMVAKWAAHQPEPDRDRADAVDSGMAGDSLTLERDR